MIVNHATKKMNLLMNLIKKKKSKVNVKLASRIKINYH